MGDYGFKVSKPGFDVKTATTDQLAVTSANLSDIVFLTVSAALHSAASKTASVTINHNLGYVPRFLVYNTDEFILLPFLSGNTTGSFFAYNCYATTNTIVVNTYGSSAITLTENLTVKILYGPVQ